MKAGEYLKTYGWIIIVIAVVIAGIFSAMTDNPERKPDRGVDSVTEFDNAPIKKYSLDDGTTCYISKERYAGGLHCFKQ